VALLGGRDAVGEESHFVFSLRTSVSLFLQYELDLGRH
jgi:hypothetical protein